MRTLQSGAPAYSSGGGVDTTPSSRTATEGPSSGPGTTEDPGQSVPFHKAKGLRPDGRYHRRVGTLALPSFPPLESPVCYPHTMLHALQAAEPGRQSQRSQVSGRSRGAPQAS